MKTGREARGPVRRVALAGVPNSGKSTLFNVLTGGNAVTGNYAGMTVDVLTGRGRRELFPETEVLITDLPGLWSLRAFTPEEGAAAAALRSGGFDAAVVVIDALAPERGIFLALRLRALGIPLTAAVNLCDALRARGGKADGAELSRLLGFPAVPVSAARGEGIAGLCRAITAQLGEDQKKTAAAGAAEPPFGAGGAMGRLYAGLCALTGGRADAVCALLEGDDGALKRSSVSPEALRACREAVQSFRDPAFTDAYEAFACLRHRRAREIAARAFVLPGAGPPPLTAAADRFLLGRHTAVPCFGLICAAVLLLTFGPAGKRASEWAGGCFSALCLSLRNSCGRLFPSGLPVWVTGLVFDGFLTGVGSVLDFLPRVLLLFFCMSLLEDSGVMARAAYVGDGLLRRAGLPGRAFLPLLTGFGCTVPAALAARTVAPERERRLTLRLLPLMSCSARMPVYTVFCAAFFPGKEAAVCAGLYLCGVLLALAGARLYRLLSPGNEETYPGPSVLPDYRLPRLRGVWNSLRRHCSGFLGRVFGTVGLCSCAVWFLGAFGPGLVPASAPESSLLAVLGRGLCPVFAPMGFGSPEACAALISGLFAKEAVVGALSVMSGGRPLSALFTPRSAAAYLCFVLLYSPCAAALSALGRELGSRRQALGLALCRCALAYLFSCAVYALGGLLSG